MKKEFKFLSVFILMFFLMTSVSFAAPKNNQEKDKTTTPLIDMDQYVSEFNNRVYQSTNSWGDDYTVTITKENVDLNNYIVNWVYSNGNKEVYHMQTKDDGKYMKDYDVYHYDQAIGDYVLAGTRAFDPPFKRWPIGNINPYDAWGGIYTYIVNYSGNPTPNTKPEWRDYSFIGYGTVTVPYGTFENALKVRRLRSDSGYSIYWYVPQIGLVKSENIYRKEGGTETLELKSASY